jgi:hypothetical protein
VPDDGFCNAETCSTLENKSVVQVWFWMMVLLFACFYNLCSSLASVLNGDQRPSEFHTSNILPVSRLSELQSASHVRLRHADLTAAARQSSTHFQARANKFQPFALISSFLL